MPARRRTLGLHWSSLEALPKVTESCRTIQHSTSVHCDRLGTFGRCFATRVHAMSRQLLILTASFASGIALSEKAPWRIWAAAFTAFFLAGIFLRRKPLPFLAALFVLFGGSK